MIVHDLKTWPEPFEAMWQGHKKAEFRKTDRKFEVGDIVILREYDPELGQYTGRVLEGEITDIRRAGPFGIPEGYVMFSVEVGFYGDSAGPGQPKTLFSFQR